MVECFDIIFCSFLLTRTHTKKHNVCRPNNIADNKFRAICTKLLPEINNVDFWYIDDCM